MKIFDFIKQAKHLDPFKKEDMDVIIQAVNKFGLRALRIILRGKTFTPEQKILVIDYLYKTRILWAKDIRPVLKLFRTRKEALALAQWILQNDCDRALPLPKNLGPKEKLILALAFPEKKKTIINAQD